MLSSSPSTRFWLPMNLLFFSFAAGGPHFWVFFIPNKQACLIVHGYVTLLLSPSFWASHSSTEQFPYQWLINHQKLVAVPHVFFAKHLFVCHHDFGYPFVKFPGCRTSETRSFLWWGQLECWSGWGDQRKVVFLTSEYPLSSSFVKLKQIGLQTFSICLQSLICGVTFCWLEKWRLIVTNWHVCFSWGAKSHMAFNTNSLKILSKSEICEWYSYIHYFKISQMGWIISILLNHIRFFHIWHKIINPQFKWSGY